MFSEAKINYPFSFEVDKWSAYCIQNILPNDLKNRLQLGRELFQETIIPTDHLIRLRLNGREEITS